MSGIHWTNGWPLFLCTAYSVLWSLALLRIEQIFSISYSDFVRVQKLKLNNLSKIYLEPDFDSVVDLIWRWSFLLHIRRRWYWRISHEIVENRNLDSHTLTENLKNSQEFHKKFHRLRLSTSTFSSKVLPWSGCNLKILW